MRWFSLSNMCGYIDRQALKAFAQSKIPEKHEKASKMENISYDTHYLTADGEDIWSDPHVPCDMSQKFSGSYTSANEEKRQFLKLWNGKNNLHLRVLNLQKFQISISSQINSPFVAPADDISIFQNWEMQTNLFSFAPPCFDTCWIYFGWIKGQSVTNGAVKIIIDNCFETFYWLFSSQVKIRSWVDFWSHSWIWKQHFEFPSHASLFSSSINRFSISPPINVCRLNPSLPTSAAPNIFSQEFFPFFGNIVIMLPSPFVS